MPGWEDREPRDRLPPELQADLRSAVRMWARRQPRREQVLCFLGGDVVRAWELTRLMTELDERSRALPIYRTLRPGRAVRTDRHILNMCAVEIERTSLIELLAGLRGQPPEAGPAAPRAVT